MTNFINRMFSLCFALLLLLLVGCVNSDTPDTQSPSASVVVPTQAPVSTLVPTFTPLPRDISLLPTITPDASRPRPTTAPSPTPIPFDEKVVEIRYIIPALGLDRRLEGNIGGQITIVDETQQFAIRRTNQSNILLELQQALPDIELAALPEGCDGCVYFEYTLPFADLTGSGWLRNPVLLASVENYMAVALGPHFPPGTVVGLRRSASAYFPAHSVAFLADGRFWVWLATELQVDDPLTLDTPLPAILNQTPITTLASQYTVSCPAEPIEMLKFQTTEGVKDISIRCPSFSLPTTLLPLYLQLDQVLSGKLATYEDGPPRPQTGFPLAAVLDYKRLDNTRLTLYQNGRVEAWETTNLVYTGTMTTTRLISLTADLLSSSDLKPGLTTFFDDETDSGTPTGTETPEVPTSLLLVRGLDGVYDGEWSTLTDPVLTELNQLLDSYLGLSVPEEAAVPEETEGTPTDTATTTPSP